MKRHIGMIVAFLILASVPFGAQKAPSVVHVGYFPNITHAQALVGKASGRFDRALAPDAHIDWKEFNAGPSAIEALYAGAIDLTYVGPNPAISGYLHSNGAALRVIAGAASGGASLVVRPGANIQKPEDFQGKKIATPQLGNTQDVALRGWLLAHNLKPREKGGNVWIIPIANPDQLTLLQKGEIDAAWAPEPWASRLIHEGGAKLFLDERDLWPNHQFSITLLVASTKFLKEHPDLAEKWVRAHVEVTEWIRQNSDEAKRELNAEIQKDTGKALAPQILNEAFTRLEVTYDPIKSSVETSAQDAYEQGFLGRERPDLSGLFDLTLLNNVLREKKEKPVK